MLNSKIISEFEKLIAFINVELDNAHAEKDTKKVTSNTFRLKQLRNILSILKIYPEEITVNNLANLKDISGIGKGSIDRISEILQKGSLSELSNFIDNSVPKNKITADLESVVGIGHTKALELYNLGVKSVKDLIKKINSNDIEVNEKIMLGLKYYGKFEGNIPRKEIGKIYKIFTSIFKRFNKRLGNDEKYIFEICGSYRREKSTSGDIDILISKFGKLDDDVNYLETIIKRLKEPLKRNQGKPLIIDDLTDKSIHTKYMGFCKYKENPPRRIDIRFVPYVSYYSALVYFTGSADLNKEMRRIAKTKKLKLSEYGLFKENGDKLEIRSERDIFDILGLEYLHPRLR